MKQCFKCGEVKDLSCFYKHKQMKDGHLGKCKDCTRKDVQTNRKNNIEYYREYDRNRRSRTKKETKKAYRLRKPAAYAARNQVNNYLRDGKISKPDRCESCGNSHERLHAHHHDYSKPLDIAWLCPPCHFDWHQKYGEANNGSRQQENRGGIPTPYAGPEC